MAKRKKKLNKKLVIALSAVTVLLLVAVGAGLYKYRNVLIPKDPAPYAKAGLEALEKKDYKLAAQELGIAANAAGGKDANAKKIKAKYYYDLGRVYLEWFKNGKELSESQRRDCWRSCLGSMRQATTLDRTYLDPHETLYSLYWQMTYARVQQSRAEVDWMPFIEATGALINIVPDKHEAYYRRGMAWSNIGERTADTEAWKKGLADFRKAIELDTDNVDYWRAWLVLLRWAEPRDATVDLDAGFTEAFEANPNSAALRILYASYLRRKDRSDEAEEQLREAIKCEPNSPRGRIAMANFLSRSEQYDAALKELVKAERNVFKALTNADGDPKAKRTALKALVDPEAKRAVRKALAEAEAKRDAIKAVAEARDVLKALAEAEDALKALPEVYLQRSRIHRVGKKIGDAVKVLQDGVAALEPKLSAAAAIQPASLETRALTEQMNRLNFALADAALDHRRTITDKEQQVAMAVLAKACFDKLDNLPANSPHRAKLAGRLDVIRGDHQGAIRNLELAYEAFGLADLQIPALLIGLYNSNSVNMPGKAEKLLISLQNAPRLQDSIDVMLALARLKIRYQDYDAADNYVNRALRTDAQHKAALQLKSELQLLTGKDASTLQVGALSTAGIKALMGQADSKWAEGQQKEALAMLVNLRKAMPKELLLAERAINMHLLLGDKDSAKAIVTEMLTTYPDNDNLKFQAQLLDKTPDERFAMQLARIDEKITDPFVRAWAKARTASRAGKGELHSKFLAEAIALKPDNPGIIAIQFRTALYNKNWAAALAAVQRVEKTDELRGKAMHAELLVRQGRHAEAIEVLVPLRKSNPDSKFILRTLGECYLATKKIDLAEDVFGVLESNDPGDVTALIGLAIVSQQQGRLGDNEEYVIRAHRRPAGRKHPYISSRYLEIRESKATGDEITEIIKRREELHKIGTRDPNYLNNLARLARLCEYRTRDLTRAEELYREAYEKTGRSQQWGRTLAFFYARNGESAKGEAVLKAGISEARIASTRIAWHVMHGEFLTMYDPNQALRAYNQASSIDPKNPLPFKAKAALYAKVGRWPQAIEHMVAYVAKRGEDIRGRKTLIQYRINGRQYDQAEKELEALLSRNPTDAQALLLKAVMLRLRGSPAKAIIVATQAIEKHPEFSAARSVRARAYLVMGELEMAKNDLEAARTLSKTPQVSMELADVYARLGREEDAILVLKSIVAEYQTYEAALYKLIGAYLQEKDWPGAESRIADAHRLFPRQATFWIVEAGMWQKRDQDAKAVVALEKAFELGKESIPVVRVYLQGLLKAGAYDKALTVADTYRSKPLWSVWINAVIGRIMVAKKQDSKANDLFLKSVENARPDELPFVVSQIREAYGPKVAIERMVAWSKQRPADWYVKVLVGDLCSAAVADPEGKLTAAERSQYLKLAIDSYVVAVGKTKKPEDVAMLSIRLGKAYYDIGKPQEAEKAYIKCLEIVPSNSAALNNLAYLYVDDLNVPEKALPYVRKVIRLRPQDPNVLDTYGWVLARLKRYAEAKKYLQRSIERDPLLAACRYHLGWVFEQTKDTTQALKHYRLGIELVRTKPHLPLYKRFQDALKRLGA